MKPFLLHLLTLLAAGAALANPKPVRVVWDPPTPEDAPHVEGYKIFSLTISLPLKPVDFTGKRVSPLSPAYLGWS